MSTRFWMTQWEYGNWGQKILEERGKWKEPVYNHSGPEIAIVTYRDPEPDDWQSPDHEGPCCGSCNWEWAYTDIGMRNFDFGCCCRTEAL